MTEPYIPQVGHQVKVEITGTVTRDCYPGGWRGVRGATGRVLYLPLDLSWTRLPDPEPDWQPGDIVIDADGAVFIRRAHGDWEHRGELVFDHYATRPLTRLVPETPA